MPIVLARLLLLLSAPVLVPQQEADAIPATPFDRVVELELSAEDPPLEGRGSAKWVEYEAEFSGTLHVWTRSELDLFLRVEDGASKLLAGDDDSGGKPTPYLALVVEPGKRLRIAVAASTPEDLGALELHLVAAPENEATRTATELGRTRLQEAAELQKAADLQGARHLLSETLAELLAVEGAGCSEAIADVLWDLGHRAWGVGDPPTARKAWEWVRDRRERTLPDDHPDLLAARLNLANTMYSMGDLPGARGLQERALEGYERTLPENHPDLLAVRMNLAGTMYSMGDLPGARGLFERVLEGYERTLPEDHPNLLAARGNLANTMYSMGDLPGARGLQERVLEGYERTLPEDHPYRLAARLNLAATMRSMGDLPGARVLQERVLEARERTLPENHPDLLVARLSLAITTYSMGDLPGARVLQERALEGYERTLLEDHPNLLAARGNLANTMRSMGDLPGARGLQESVLEGYERTLPEDHPNLHAARLNLAGTMYSMGDLSGARGLQERALEGYERTLPEDAPALLAARLSLAGTLRSMGDLPGARGLQERVLEGFECTFPEDHPNLLAARGNLANTLLSMGDLPGARGLQERVLEGFEHTLAEVHPDLLAARLNLANTLLSMGDLPGARGLQERALEGYERTLPEDHPDLLAARGNLANTLYSMGDLPGARGLFERVLAARERTFPEDHADLLLAQLSLAITLYSMGDLPGARALIPEFVSRMLRRALSALLLAPREAREVVGADAHPLAQALFLSDSADSAASERIFELIETRRLVASEGSRAANLLASDATLAPLALEASTKRSELNDLVSGGAREGATPEDLREELSRLALERDRAEGSIRRELAHRGFVARAVETVALGAAIPEGSAGVGYLRSPRWRFDEETGQVVGGEDHLLAHVSCPGGALERVELGNAAEVEELVAAWRAAIGKPLAGRGIGTEPTLSSERPLHEFGRLLRERLLDPILAVSGDETRTLFLCPDDLVYLVPLDALPLGEGVVGDRLRIVILPSFGPLIRPPDPTRSDPSLLVLGGVAYEADPATAAPVLASVTAPIESTSRAGGQIFDRLPGTAEEVALLSVLFEKTFEREAVVLTEDRASKAALAEHASAARFVHLATHGWFAPESVKSILDPSPVERGGWQRMSFEEQVTGFAPMTLCGLALAGANKGRDSLGRVPGILTAEELCALDLSQCELAVLSACETNVGIRRAGQGIQSLQAALHAAGARTSITSLWKVDDAATRRLFELFYAKLWKEKLGKADALWQAKMALRAEGHPVRDWATWVLSGDPD